jgi:hypothetical protein
MLLFKELKEEETSAMLTESVLEYSNYLLTGE